MKIFVLHQCTVPNKLWKYLAYTSALCRIKYENILSILSCVKHSWEHFVGQSIGLRVNMETFYWTRSLLICKNLCILRWTISKPYIRRKFPWSGGLPFSGSENPMAPLPLMQDQRYSASHYCRVLLDRIFFKNEIFLWLFSETTMPIGFYMVENGPSRGKILNSSIELSFFFGHNI